MKIAIACDHRGYEAKELIKNMLGRTGHEVIDFGTDESKSCDYPDYAIPAALTVARGEADYGVLICDTGIGMSIAANKVKGIRAALCHDVFSAARARQHNDANILCLAAGGNPEGVAEVVNTFFTTQFEGGRHLRRLNKIKAMEG